MDRKPDQMDENLRQFPKHEMDKDKQDSIHDTLMQTRVGRSQSKNKFRKKKWVAGIASVAALLLFSVLGLSFFFDNDVNTANDGGNGEYPNAMNAPEKGDSHLKTKEAKEQAGNHQAASSHESVTDDDDFDQSDSGLSDSEGTGGVDEGNQNTEETDDSDETDQDEKDRDKEENKEDVEEDIQTLAGKTIDALNERDMETVAEYVHPEKGLLFSPYVNIMDDAVVFSKDEVNGMLDTDEVYDWGDYDGKGTPIELTPEEYFDEFLDMASYLEPDDIRVDDIKDRGNTLNNIQDVFPGAHIVEYYNDGSEEYEGIDWSSVNLVYEENESGNLKLVAIVRDMWTV